MMNDWTQEPLIIWQQDYCKFCTMPLNGCTQCDLAADPEKQEGYMWNNVFIAIKSKSCPFREMNSWRVDVNFPVSKPLLKRLNSVNGLKSCRPVGPNQMVVEISKLVAKEQVEKDFNNTFVAFIKEQQQNLKVVDKLIDTQVEALLELPNNTSVVVPKEIKEILQDELND
jgi:hypothetical protein